MASGSADAYSLDSSPDAERWEYEAEALMHVWLDEHYSFADDEARHALEYAAWTTLADMDAEDERYNSADELELTRSGEAKLRRALARTWREQCKHQSRQAAPLIRPMLVARRRGDRRLRSGRPRARRRTASRDGPSDDGGESEPASAAGAAVLLLRPDNAPLGRPPSRSRTAPFWQSARVLERTVLCPITHAISSSSQPGSRTNWLTPSGCAREPRTEASPQLCAGRRACISPFKAKGRLAAGPSITIVTAIDMNHPTQPADGNGARPHRRAAVARVPALALRRLEHAICCCPDCRRWAREQLALYSELAEWRAVDLPVDEEAA